MIWQFAQECQAGMTFRVFVPRCIARHEVGGDTNAWLIGLIWTRSVQGQTMVETNLAGLQLAVRFVPRASCTHMKLFLHLINISRVEASVCRKKSPFMRTGYDAHRAICPACLLQRYPSGQEIRRVTALPVTVVLVPANVRCVALCRSIRRWFFDYLTVPETNAINPHQPCGQHSEGWVANRSINCGINELRSEERRV